MTDCDEGDRRRGPEAHLRDWLAIWTQLAQAQSEAAQALAGDHAAVEAEAFWSALDAQAALARAAVTRFAAGARSPVGAATLARLLDPGQWLFAGMDAIDPALRRLIDGPQMAELAEFGRSGLSATQEWRALRLARAAHRRLVGAAIARLAQRFAAESAAHETLEPAAALERWTEAAETELDALRASDAFIASQTRLMMAAAALRKVELAMIDSWCATRGLPARAEIDDLHRAVTDLRRELRALKRALGRP